MVSSRPRGVALAALSALLTTIGHAAAGGGLPDVSVLVVVVPLLAGAFVALAERTRGPVATVAVLGAGQLVLHTTLAALHTMPAVNDVAMLGVHVLITLITAVAIRHADVAVAAVAAVLRRVLPRRITPPAADRPLATRPVPAPDLSARRARRLTVADVRRGPPVWG
ncbi:MAG TPA: hypothetical protein VGE11_18825 [Pseudonocardia sp.]